VAAWNYLQVDSLVKLVAHRASASDFTIHKDEERKQRYINRHKKNENWNDKDSAGAWSRWLLWNKPTINESYDYIKKKFNI
jgi:hypothetical protein